MTCVRSACESHRGAPKRGHHRMDPSSMRVPAPVHTSGVLRRAIHLSCWVILLILSCGPPRSASQYPTGFQGYFEGTAQSHWAGVLDVALSLRQGDGGLAGELVTPLGTYPLTDGSSGNGSGLLPFDVSGETWMRGSLI